MADSPPSDQHVFLSYASAERDRALAIADALEAAGIPVWIDRRGIAGGTHWIEEIAKAVREAPILIVLCSVASVNSRNVRQELQLAWDQDKPILPLLLEPVAFPDAVAYILHGRQWIELFDRPVAEWVAETRAALATLATPTSPEASAVFRGSGESEPAQPPSRSPGPRPAHSNLPAPPTRLIGRDDELAAVMALLQVHRLVTLTGPGGTGKTRLAIEIASQLTGLFPDGILFVDLSVVIEPAQLLPKIAETAGVRESSDRSLRAGLAAFFAGRRMMLLLDNVEHLLPAASDIADLLADSPELRITATSRALLRLRAEREFVVAPLAASPAISLFIELARTANPALPITPESLDAAADICRRLDGLPLAIELAAVRVKHLSIEKLLSWLGERLPVLTGGARDLPARQQTLRNTIAWSYELVSPRGQRLFRRLSVFAGGCSLEAAEAVCAFDHDVFEALTLLVDHSLLRQETRNGHEARFAMLETIREFGLAMLHEHGEDEIARDAHASWVELYIERLKTAGGPGLTRSPMRRLRAEIENVRLALERLAVTGEYERLLAMCNAVTWEFGLFVGGFGEARSIIEHALRDSPNCPPRLRAQTLFTLGYLVWAQGVYDQALDLATQSITIFRELDDREGLAFSLVLRGATLEQQRDPESAETSFLEALEIGRGLDSDFTVGFTMSQLGSLALATGHWPTSIDWSNQALDAFNKAGAVWQKGLALLNLGEAVFELGDIAGGAEHFASSLRLWVELETPSYQCYPVAGLGRVAVALGEYSLAARLFGAEERMRNVAGVRIWRYQKDWHERSVNKTHERLGPEAFDAEWLIGRSLSIAQIEALAQEVVTAVQLPSNGQDQAVP